MPISFLNLLEIIRNTFRNRDCLVLPNTPHNNIMEGEEQEQQCLVARASVPEKTEDFNPLHNFLKFSLTFSLTHATVDGILIYATAELGKDLGAVSSGLLYFLYSFSALLYSRSYLRSKGSKHALMFGMFSLLTYVTTFLLAVAIPSIKWYVCVPGAVVGGVGAGVLWPAQGSYYSDSAQRYSQEQAIPIQSSQNLLAGYFAGLYLGIEGLSKLFVTILFLVSPHGEWKLASFLVYSIIALVSTFFCTTIKAFPKEISSTNLFPSSSSSMLCEGVSWSSADLASLIDLFLTHPVFFALLPFQASFGLCSSYMAYNIDGIILPEHNKEGYIGGLGALSILTAALCTLPVTLLTQTSAHSSSRFGQSFVMLLGPFLFGFCSSVVLYLRSSQIASWSVIIPLVIAYGIGRGIWENTNKSVIAAISLSSPHHRDIIFSTVYFISGITSAMGFLLYRFVSLEVVGVLIIIVSLIGMMGNYHCDQYCNKIL
jgi:MFS family permease